MLNQGFENKKNQTKFFLFPNHCFSSATGEPKDKKDFSTVFFKDCVCSPMFDPCTSGSRAGSPVGRVKYSVTVIRAWRLLVPQTVSQIMAVTLNERAASLKEENSCLCLSMHGC